MPSHRKRLDRFISDRTGINRRHVRPLLARGQIKVDGAIATDISQVIHQFSRITLDDEVLQDNTPAYVMLNKPAGVVSATRDDKHRTVVDLLGSPDRHSLHIPGRLDFNSTGLLLLTNDGDWSRRLGLPEAKVAKRYRVTLENPATEKYIEAFAEGMYFAFEDITTQPARLEIISDHVAELTLTEGRYHQIKRMFGRFQNRVLELHRLAIGNLLLDPNLAPGESRALTPSEVETIASPCRPPAKPVSGSFFGHDGVTRRTIFPDL